MGETGADYDYQIDMTNDGRYRIRSIFKPVSGDATNTLTIGNTREVIHPNGFKTDPEVLESISIQPQEGDETHYVGTSGA